MLSIVATVKKRSATWELGVPPVRGNWVAGILAIFHSVAQFRSWVIFRVEFEGERALDVCALFQRELVCPTFDTHTNTHRSQEHENFSALVWYNLAAARAERHAYRCEFRFLIRYLAFFFLSLYARRANWSEKCSRTRAVHNIVCVWNETGSTI